MQLKNIQTCYPLHSKKYTCYQRMFREEGERRRGEKKERDFFILTQQALRHAISPNYEGRGAGESEITQKNKKLSVENLEHFPKYTNFPKQHIS